MSLVDVTEGFDRWTWWWHREDGRRTMYPQMTLEHQEEGPITSETRFRCVKCKVEGTFEELKKKSCSNPEWYHGDIDEYRQTHEPMYCNGCGHDWVVVPWHGWTGRSCPKCQSKSTEKIV